MGSGGAGSLGERVGSYRLVRRLGAGGQGTVWEADDDEGRRVALKFLDRRELADSDVSARARRELSILQSLDSRYVAGFVDADLDATTPWIATDFIPGLTLEQMLGQAGSLDDPVRFARGLAQSLAHVHHHDIAHLDVKPANIIWDVETDYVRLVDFGIARGRPTGETGEQVPMYTEGWSSPEQIAGGVGTPASDVYSWGLVAVMAAAGHRPFGVALARNTIERVEPDLSDVPDRLRDLCGRALARDPLQRPTAADLKAELDATRVDRPVSAGASAGRSAALAAPRGDGSEKERKMSPAQVVGIVVATLIAGVGLALGGLAIVDSNDDESARNVGLSATTLAVPTTVATLPAPTEVIKPAGCDPAYPDADVCIPSPPPDLDCPDVAYTRFTVVAPDPHRFDIDGDGVGCEPSPVP